MQIPGVLDDVYAKAAEAELGPAGGTDAQAVGLGADRAEGGAGALRRLDGRRPYGPRDAARRRDRRLVGAGPASWKGRYYTFLVTVYSPAAGKVVTNEVTDPYSLSLAADSVRSQVVTCPTGPCTRGLVLPGQTQARAAAEGVDLRAARA